MIKSHGAYSRKAVEKYLHRLNLPVEGKIYDSTVTDILVKAGIEVEEDPASLFDPKQLWDGLFRYDSEDKPRPDDRCVDSAVNRAYRIFAKPKDLRPLQSLRLSDELKSAIKLDRSAGIYMTSKLESWDLALARAEKVLRDEAAPNPCLVGCRTQRGGKTRLVWMYPLDVTMMEACFARPLINVFKEIPSPMPYAMRRADLGAKLNFAITERNKVCLDFSKFDSSVPSWMINVAFDILQTWFEMDEATMRMWRKVRYYFIHTPIVMPDANIYRGKSKGVPSGSYFTQLIDSIVNYIVITYVGLKEDFKLHERRVFVLGDDSVFSTNADVNLDNVALHCSYLGFTLNVKKSSVSRDYVHFLGFEWVDGLAYKSNSDIVKSMTQPERWRKRESDRTKEGIRALRMICEMVHLTNDPTLAIKLYSHDPRARLYMFGQPALKDPGDLPGYLGFVRAEEGKPLDRTAVSAYLT